MSYGLVCPHLENPSDFPKPVFIRRGLCRDTPQLIYINVVSKLKSQPHKQHIWFFSTRKPTHKNQKSSFLPTPNKRNMINWTSQNILKINNDIDCFETDTVDESKIDSLRKQIEPWLTAIFQSEHFSLLTGAGLPIGLTFLADVTAQGMGRIEFSEFKDEIKKWSDKSAIAMGRGAANIEDDFRSAIELLQGLKIQGSASSVALEKDINKKLEDFIRNITKTEKDFFHSAKFNAALSILKSFLISFSSRTATRERTNIFTTNYDRFIELGLDSAGILSI